jgi:hypothetical protein
MVCLALEPRGQSPRLWAEFGQRSAAHDQPNMRGPLRMSSKPTSRTILVLDLPLGRLGYYLGAFLGNIDVDERRSIVILEG